MGLDLHISGPGLDLHRTLEAGDPALVLERPHDSLALALDDDRWNRGVLVDLKQARFDGEVTVDWLDAGGARLASSTYRANDTRFRLPIPSALGDHATQLRVYAASPDGGRDAIGGLEFGNKTKPARTWKAAATAWWKHLTQPAPRRSERSEDTIAILDFDGPAR